MLSDPTPHYVTTPSGQVRLWLTGDGPTLVMLAGLTAAAPRTAELLSDLCPGWRIVVVELPGIGGSAWANTGTIDETASIIGEALHWLEDDPFVLVGQDLSCAIAGHLCAIFPRTYLAKTIFVGADTAEGWAQAPISPGDLSPRQDGTHLQALWAFLRDRHLLEAANPSLPSKVGEPLPEPNTLSEHFVAASVKPTRFADLWDTCIAGIENYRSGDIARVTRLANLPEHIGDLSLADGKEFPPRTAAGPSETIWYDYVKTNRGRMHLRRSGGTGRPVLVLPTGGGSSAQFSPVICGLAKDRQVFAVDYIGNGLSDKPSGPVSIETLAEDMVALLDALGVDNVDVWGSHTGALVALELAVTAPERVGRLVMEGPVFISQDFKDDLLANYFPTIAPDKWGLHLPLVWNWRRDLFMFWPWYRVDRGAARDLGVPSADELHMYATGILESGVTYDGAYRAAFSYDTRNRITQLTRPTLVCAGPNDMLKDGLPEAKSLGPEGVVTVTETPTTVWWPDPDKDEAAATLNLYRRFLDGKDCDFA